MSGRRLMLRAELVQGGVRLVATTSEVALDRLVVATAQPATAGESIEIELSLPGVLAPLVGRATVESARLPAGPANPGQWVLRPAFDERQRALLAEALATSPRGAAPEAPYRILLVEDSALTREIFSHELDRFFAGRELVVEVAGDAEAGWAELGRSRFDLVVVDYYLPDQSGDRLIGRIRREPHLAGTVVVAVSMGGERARHDSLAAGADLFLDKPVALGDLFATVERLVAARRRTA
jgi:CheY-like chemotaxis protein